MYVIVPHLWPDKAALYTRLNRLDHSAKNGASFVTVFTCEHRHLTLDVAGSCPDVLAARKADQERAEAVES